MIMLAFTRQRSREDELGKRGQHQPEALQLALAKMQEQQLEMSQVSRVAVERAGDIYIEVEAAGGQRWFSFIGNELQELLPQCDLKIPLLSELTGGNYSSAPSVISYRPGRRIVLSQKNSVQDHFIKGYKKRRGAQAATSHEIAVSACRQAGFDVPQLLQYVEESDYLVMTRQPGKEPEINSDTVDVWARIGCYLRLFQQSGIETQLQDFTCMDELTVLDERARRLLLALPDLPARWQSGRELLQDAATKLPIAEIGLAHRDLHDGQFLVAGGSICLLDFDLLCRADLALDAGNLLAHLGLRQLQRPDATGVSGVSNCSRAFLSGLGKCDEPGFGQRLLFYQATTFYRLALLYALRPRWMHLVDILISRGKSCIDALNRAQGSS
jgi:hypothetical protein